jgi:hypothetical protein
MKLKELEQRLNVLGFTLDHDKLLNMNNTGNGIRFKHEIYGEIVVHCLCSSNDKKYNVLNDLVVQFKMDGTLWINKEIEGIVSTLENVYKNIHLEDK